MNPSLGAPHSRHWYTRSDRGKLCEVTSRGGHSGAIAVCVFDGRGAFLADRTWRELPSSRPPQRVATTRETLSRPI